jgi:tRNA threonylcarbamoyladenosine biosynthesis protein TsaB
VYTAVFDQNNHTILDTRAEIIDADSFTDILEQNEVYFFGNGSDKVQSTITSARAHFLQGIETSARNMVTLAESKFQNQQWEDVAYFEPFYLKDFVATTAKNKMVIN